MYGYRVMKTYGEADLPREVFEYLQTFVLLAIIMLLINDYYLLFKKYQTQIIIIITVNILSLGAPPPRPLPEGGGPPLAGPYISICQNTNDRYQYLPSFT